MTWDELTFEVLHGIAGAATWYRPRIGESFGKPATSLRDREVSWEKIGWAWDPALVEGNDCKVFGAAHVVQSKCRVACGLA